MSKYYWKNTKKDGEQFFGIVLLEESPTFCGKNAFEIKVLVKTFSKSWVALKIQEI